MVRYPSLYQINTRVWLRELGFTLGRPATLADIPDEFLDQVAALGFDYVWFLGLWQTGSAGRQVSLSHPEWLREFQATLPDFTEADVSGSPFAVTGYTLHRDFGRETDLSSLKERLRARAAVGSSGTKPTISLSPLALQALFQAEEAPPPGRNPRAGCSP